MSARMPLDSSPQPPPQETTVFPGTPPAPGSRRLASLGLTLGILALLFGAYRVFGFVQDDAFITYRYSANLRNGFGAVFNAGERTEGYSCPLYMAGTALLMFLPGDPLFRAKVLGVLFALGAIWAVMRLARSLGMPVWAQGAVAGLLGMNTSFSLSAIDGMETSLQAFLVTMAAYRFVEEEKQRRGWSSSLWLLAAALNRPEGLLFFAAALGVRLTGRLRRPTDATADSPVRTVRWFVAFLLPMTAFFLWRHAYYGEWLPNTVAAKQMPLETALNEKYGPAYLIRTLFVNLDGRPLQIGTGIVLWVCALAGAVSERLRGRGRAIVWVFVLCQMLVALRAGGDWMQGWRYMTAVVPLWMLLLVTAVQDAAAGLASRSRPAGRVMALAGTLLFAGVCLWAAPEFRQPEDGAISWAEFGWAADSRRLLHGFKMENTVTIADFLNEKIPAGSVVAYSEIGATPYFSQGLRYLDTYGLTDHEIAHLPEIARFRTGAVGDYTSPTTDIGKHLLRRRPDYVVRGISAYTPVPTILGGSYTFLDSTPLTNFKGKEPVVFVIWKRRTETAFAEERR